MLLFNEGPPLTFETVSVGNGMVTLEADLAILNGEIKRLHKVLYNVSCLEKLEQVEVIDERVHDITYNVIKQDLMTNRVLTLEGLRGKDGIIAKVWLAIRMAWEKVKMTTMAIVKWVKSLFVNIDETVDVVKFAAEYKKEIKDSGLTEREKGDMLVLMHNATFVRKHMSYVDLAENFNIDIEDLFESMSGHLDVDFRTITTNYHVKKGELFIERKTPSTTPYQFSELLKIKGIFEQAISSTQAFMDGITRASSYRKPEELSFVQPMVTQAGMDYKMLILIFSLIGSRLGVVMYVMDSIRAGKAMPIEEETKQFIEKVKL